MFANTCFKIFVPRQISAILRFKELKVPVLSKIVKMVEINQLPSNDPCEDTNFEVKCLHSPGMCVCLCNDSGTILKLYIDYYVQMTFGIFTGFLFGVCDGHGGQNCSISVSRRLKNYIAASLLPSDMLKNITSENTIPLLVKTVTREEVSICYICWLKFHAFVCQGYISSIQVHLGETVVLLLELDLNRRLLIGYAMEILNQTF